MRLEPGTDLIGANEVRARLDRFPDTERGRLVARARTAAAAAAASGGEL